MNVTIKAVDTNFVHQVWPSVKFFIQSALDTEKDAPEWSHNYNLDHIQQYVTSGQWLLLVALNDQGGVQGCATVSFINYPMHRVAFVTATGGKFISSQDVFAQLKAILKGYGATKIQGFGRDSIVRLWRRFNFEPRNTLVEVLI